MKDNIHSEVDQWRDRERPREQLWLCVYVCISESGQLGMWPPRVLLTAVTAGLGSVCVCVCVSDLPEGVRVTKGDKNHGCTQSHIPSFSLLEPEPSSLCFAFSCLFLSVHHCPPTATRARRRTWLSCSSKEHFVWIIAHFLLVLLAVGVLGLV